MVLSTVAEAPPQKDAAQSNTSPSRNDTKRMQDLPMERPYHDAAPRKASTRIGRRRVPACACKWRPRRFRRRLEQVICAGARMSFSELISPLIGRLALAWFFLS